jgi:hypothetical protein
MRGAADLRHFGYRHVWGMIVATTLVQLWFYDRRSWI